MSEDSLGPQFNGVKQAAALSGGIGEPISLSGPSKSSEPPGRMSGGRWIRDADGYAVGYAADHEPLVKHAMSQWKGSATDMRGMVDDAAHYRPIRGSGGTKIAAAAAHALLEELKFNGQPNTQTLYRGDTSERPGIAEYTPHRRVANRFAKMYGGEVRKYPPGTVHGLDMQDYINNSINAEEQGFLGHRIDGERP